MVSQHEKVPKSSGLLLAVYFASAIVLLFPLEYALSRNGPSLAACSFTGRTPDHLLMT